MKKLLLINAISFSLLAMNTEDTDEQLKKIHALRFNKEYGEFVYYLGGSMSRKEAGFVLYFIEKLSKEGYKFEDIPGRLGTDNLLHTIASNAHEKFAPQIARKLIEQGIHPNTKNGAGETCLGRVCPHIAEDKFYLMLKILLENGADPNEPIHDETKQTVLHRKNISPSIAQLLVDHGGNPRIIDEHGKTALDYQTDSQTRAIFQK